MKLRRGRWHLAGQERAWVCTGPNVSEEQNRLRQLRKDRVSEGSWKETQRTLPCSPVLLFPPLSPPAWTELQGNKRDAQGWTFRPALVPHVYRRRLLERPWENVFADQPHAPGIVTAVIVTGANSVAFALRAPSE